jgi:UDP-glucose 4-epimerase
MRILITGASGFIGQHLSYALHEKEAYLIGFVRGAMTQQFLAEQYDVDVLDEDAIRNLIHDIQPNFVVHLAASMNREADKNVYGEVYKTNLIGSLNVINGCMGLSALKKFIFLGSTDEYGMLPAPLKESDKEAPVNPYGASKLAVTEMLKSLSRSIQFPCVILRPTVVYGPGQGESMFIPALINTLIAGKNFDMTLGEQTRDFVYVDDLVQAIIKSFNATNVDGRVINISSGTPIRIDALAKITAKLFGESAESLLMFGAKEYRIGETMSYWADNNLAKDLLGWSPKVSINHGIKRTVDFFMSKAVEGR